MTRFRKMVTIAALIGCASSAIIPLSASATYYYGKSDSFKSSYTYSERSFSKESMGEGELDGKVMGQLKSTNKCSTKFSTVTGDDKTAYVCEWNKNGTAKSASAYQNEPKVANLEVTINASFFTPVNTYHEGYSSQADTYLCYWLN
ncbi:hypothetical protein [Ruminococcus sp.]